MAAPETVGMPQSRRPFLCSVVSFETPTLALASAPHSTPRVEPTAAVALLKNSAVDAILTMQTYALDNGVHPASGGIFNRDRFQELHAANKPYPKEWLFDDVNFGTIENGVPRPRLWHRDVLKSLSWTLSPHTRTPYLNLNDPDTLRTLGIRYTPEQTYCRGVRGFMQYQAQQLPHFESRPHSPDKWGFKTIENHDAPAVKVEEDGTRHPTWTHNQPDVWGDALILLGEGYQKGWIHPRIRVGRTRMGHITRKMTEYTTELDIARFSGHAIWEHRRVHAPRHAKGLISKGLACMAEATRQVKGLSKTRLEQAAGRAREYMFEPTMEHARVGDFTDFPGHYSSGDIASWDLVGEGILTPGEIYQVSQETAPLIRPFRKQPFGARIRYVGDHWQNSPFGEARWTLEESDVALQDFREAEQAYLQGDTTTGDSFMLEGLALMTVDAEAKAEKGYIAELTRCKNDDGRFEENGNALLMKESKRARASLQGLHTMAVREALQRKSKQSPGVVRVN